MCQWFGKKEGPNTQEAPLTSLIAMTSSTLPTGSASCPVRQSLSDHDGRYTYRVMFLPGRQFFPAETVSISRPSTPTITCTPSGRVTENNTVTCTCTTDNVGQPAGRLRWLRGSSDIIASSAPGGNKLELRQTLNRSDDGVQFRCRLDWSDKSETSTVYNASVGYPPSTSELTISPSSPSRPVTVSENSTVSFTCKATGGNPPSTMTLSDVTSTQRSGPSPLTFDLPAARCEHSGVYTCTGSNGYGQAVIDTASLHVLCSPRSASPITALNFIDKKVGTSFSVTAYPLSTLTFSYLGRSKNTTSSLKNLPDSITMDGSCEATSGIVHQSTCTITVYNVTSDEAAGIYQVNVSNTQGMTNAMFEVKYRAPVPPSEEPSSGNAAVIGGVVGAVVVAVIIAAVVFVVWKRRKGSDKEHSRSTAVRSWCSLSELFTHEMSTVTERKLS
ncbi:sialic acid-binding Ig-like lectin 10 isoform X2 [Littorina saxatilis]|uniref:sialic acid-binding Ig-like lectin 10 isoform X2 n=1 Tax=Littorina saxatilis TaxID=31220 RepID=UPI0038B672B9